MTGDMLNENEEADMLINLIKYMHRLVTMKCMEY